MVVEAVNKQNKLDAFKEEVRIFRKYEQAIYDLLSLYEYLLNPYDMHTQIGNTLIKKVINTLEDPEIKINYKDDKNINEIVETVFYGHYNIFYKHIDIPECKDSVKCFKIKDEYANKFKEFLNKKGNYPKFNLMNEILMRSTNWVFQFLISNIELETRVEMFNDIIDILIKQKNYTTLCKMLNFEIYDSLDRKMLEKAKSEILNSFNNNQEILRYLLETLLQDNRFDIIESLQDKVLNFNEIYWEYKSDDYDLDGMMISTVGTLCCDDGYENNNSLNKFKLLYESASYLKVDKTARYNNDILILSHLREEDLVDFVELSNFELDEFKISMLAKRISDKYDSKQIQDINLRNKINRAIIKKTKNEEEVNYAKIFMKESDEESNKIDEIFPKEKSNNFILMFNLSREYVQTTVGKSLSKCFKYSK